VLYRLALDVIDGGGIVIGGTVGASLLAYINRCAALVILPLIVFPICEIVVLCSLWAWAARHDHPASCDTMPKDVSVDDDPEFPFPGDYTPSGFTTQYIRLQVSHPESAGAFSCRT
jgi:hypothetical protein